jgi:hypothetical protein
MVEFRETGGRAAEARAAYQIDPSAFEPSAKSRALLRGVEMAQETLRKSGGSFSLNEVRMLLHDVSRQRIDKRIHDGSLLAVPGPGNVRRFPTVQFTAEGVVAGLKEVQDALPTKNPWAILSFLVEPDVRLNNRTPIELMKAGKVDLVVQAARVMGHQGA